MDHREPTRLQIGDDHIVVQIGVTTTSLMPSALRASTTRAYDLESALPSHDVENAPFAVEPLAHRGVGAVIDDEIRAASESAPAAATMTGASSVTGLRHLPAIRDLSG
jgi:hypothetical protein